jgi:GH18 family chitinase
MHPFSSLRSFSRSQTILFVGGISMGIFLFFPPPTHAASWYDAAWPYRKAITINNTKISQTGGTVLSNFPVLISLTDPDLKYAGSGGRVTSSTGADIVFTDSDGRTALNYEIENYSPSTGNLVAWVNVPTLSPAVNHTIYAYFGNAVAPTESVATEEATWDSNFISVYHLGSITDLRTNDSTGNYPGMNNGTAVTTTGEVFGGAGFNGSSTYIYNNSFVEPTNSATLSAWAKLTDASDNWNTIADLDYGYLQLQLAARSGAGDVSWLVSHSGGSSLCKISDTDILNRWHLYAATYDSSNNALSVYVDGNKLGSCTMTGSPNFSGNSALTIGAIYKGSGGAYFYGAMDEVEASEVARSADWINTEYNNQSDPSAFYSVGALEQYASSPIINSFTASPAYISHGGNSTLSWNVTGTITSIAITPGAFTSHLSSGSVTVTPGSTTVYTLTATNNNGSATENATVTLGSTPPTVPGDLSVVTSTPSTIAFSWSASTEEGSAIAGYDIYRNGEKIASISPSTYIDTAVNSPAYVYYLDTGLTAGTAYIYAVDAYDIIGNVSAQSSGIRATTMNRAVPSISQWSAAFWMSGSGSSSTPPISAIDWSSMTHIIHGPAIPLANGMLDLTTYSIASDAPALVSAAHAHNVKVLLSIMSGWSARDDFADAANNNMATFVGNIVSAVNTYGYDGVDIDWENTASSTINWTSMTTLISDLRAALGTKLLTAEADGGDQSHWAPLSGDLDRVNVMVYDMAASWEPFIWYDSPLYGVSSAVSLDAYKNDFVNAGIPAAKIDLGLPFYGYAVQGGCQTLGCAAGISAPLQMWTTPPTWIPENEARLAGNYDLSSANPDWHWDVYAHEPYLGIDEPGNASDTFVTFEDQQSLTDKIDYIKSNDLGGWSVWNINNDYFPSEPATAQIYPLSHAVALELAGPTSALSSSIATTPQAGIGSAVSAPTSSASSSVAGMTSSQLESLLLSLESELQTLHMESSSSAPTSSVFTRDLFSGMTGADVKQLQLFLISQNIGPAAKKLAANGATTNFGSLTKAALAEFQTYAHIAPASGYFGSVTRAYVNAHD